nr:MAG TPA: hypothetical protein [Caudoviricetes sp.]
MYHYTTHNYTLFLQKRRDMLSHHGNNIPL